MACLSIFSTVSGSVEVACELGLAEGVVDLVDTGATMQQVGLESLEVVMTTEAVLISNPHSPNTAMIEKIRRRIEGYITALNHCMISYDIPRTLLPTVELITPGFDSPTIMPLENPDWVAVNALIRTSDMSSVMDRLQDAGARGIIVMPLGNTRL